MSTRTTQAAAVRKSHARSALIQWVAIGLVVALGLVAILMLTEGGSGSGGHSGAPAVTQAY